MEIVITFEAHTALLKKSVENRRFALSSPCIRDFNGHLPYPFQNPISNFYLSLEAGKSSTDSVILRKLTNVEIIFRAWTKSLKRTKMYFDD